MKRRRTAMLIAGLLSGMMLLGPAVAQHQPMPGSPYPSTPPLPTAMGYGTPATIVVPPLPTGLVVPPCAACVAAGSAAPAGPKVCTRKTETVKSSHPVYSSKDVEYCSSCAGPGKDCTGALHTKTVLVKRMVTEEKEVSRCSLDSPKPAAPSVVSAPYGAAPCASCGSGVPRYAPVVVYGNQMPAAPAMAQPLPMPSSPLPMPPAGKPAPMPLPRGAQLPPNDNLIQTSGISLPPIR